MKKIKVNLKQCLRGIEGYGDEVRYKERAAQVHTMWADIVDEIFLDHTNAVYILKKDGVKTLIVYVDESIFSAELNARRELIKLQFLQRFNEELDEFKIYISRGDYKKNHPFMKESIPPYQEPARPLPLTSEEKEPFEEKLSHIENKELRDAIEQAVVSDLEWKKGIREKSNKQS
ncbi:MAG: DUF721 domain-containing protein [Raoultibacter sp.]